MDHQTTVDVLEREHREIDAGIAEFLAAAENGTPESDPLQRAATALRRHIYLEETLMFPALRDAGLVAPVFVMVREHAQMWRLLDDIEPVLSTEAGIAAALPMCHELVGVLDAHNPKEEQILYPQTDTALPPPARAELQAFLASGEMPSGWVCEGFRMRARAFAPDA